MGEKVLFLVDVEVPSSIWNRRKFSEGMQYRSLNVLHKALSPLPHGVLLGPVLLSTILKQQGYAVEILECSFRPQQRRNLMAALRENPDYIALSSTFIMDTATMQAHVEFLRQHAPGAKIILGGASVTANAEMRTLADYCIVGEGEHALPSLLQAIRLGVPAPPLVHAPLLKDLDGGVTPDWSLLRRSPGEFHMIYTQRGCKWRCAFCTFPAKEGYKLRYRAVGKVIEEIKRNYEEFGIWRYMIADSTFTFPEDRCLELLREISALPFRVEWAAYARVDTISDEMAKLMVDSGCVGLFFGMESGSDLVLEKMKKQFTVRQMRRAGEILRGHRIPFTASWIVGFPGETPATIEETYRAIVELGADHNSINTFGLYEDSPTGLRKEVFGLEGFGMDWKHATMDSTQALEHTETLVSRVQAEGVPIGSIFDYFWLSAAGISSVQVAELFQQAQRIQNAPAAGDREDFEEKCELIFRKAVSHPAFAPREFFSGAGISPSPRPLLSSTAARS